MHQKEKSTPKSEALLKMSEKRDSLPGKLSWQGSREPDICKVK